MTKETTAVTTVTDVNKENEDPNVQGSSQAASLVSRLNILKFEGHIEVTHFFLMC